MSVTTVVEPLYGHREAVLFSDLSYSPLTGDMEAAASKAELSQFHGGCGRTPAVTNDHGHPSSESPHNKLNMTRSDQIETTDLDDSNRCKDSDIYNSNQREMNKVSMVSSEHIRGHGITACHSDSASSYIPSRNCFTDDEGYLHIND